MSAATAPRPLPLAVAFPALLVIFAIASACGGDRAGRVTVIDGGPLVSADPAAGATPGATGYPIGTLSGYDRTVEVDLGEWFVGADATRLPAGTTRFVARNVGGDVHELVLIRGTSREGEELVEIDFETEQRGVAPGQAAVFYRGSEVLGGCWIRAAVKRPASAAICSC